MPISVTWTAFLEHFIKIYDCMLNPVVKEAFNILIAEGV